MDYDAIIVGATAEGITAALTAAGMGMDVALVDRGGSSVLRGIPPGPFMLSLLHDSILEVRAAHRVLGRDLGTRASRDLFGRLLLQRREEVVAAYRTAVRRDLRESGVEVVTGRPRLLSPREVEIEGRGTRRADMIVIATGVRPRRPQRFPFDGRTVCDADTAMAQKDVPRSVVVVGADLVGCEFSCMFAALGSNVTLLDRRRRLLRFVDSDVREVLHRCMQRSGITVVLGERVARIEVRGSGTDRHAAVALESGRVEVSERVLVVAGEVPNLEGLGLEGMGIDTDSAGLVVTDDRFRTSVSGVYAVGGVVDAVTPTTTRIHQGRVAMLGAAGVDGGCEDPAPMVVYTVPEIATAGLSEEACSVLDIAHVVGRSGLGPAVSSLHGEPEGLIKLVVSSDTRRLLGVHVIGRSAAEVVGLGAALLRGEGGIELIASIGLSPQSLSASYHRAALDALTKLGGAPVPRRDAPRLPEEKRF